MPSVSWNCWLGKRSCCSNPRGFPISVECYVR